MKKRLMIFCSLITLLLAAFSFPISAEEDIVDTSSSVPVPNSIRLDAYFYDNYILLPYIESDGSQYVNTGISPSSDLTFLLKFSSTLEDDSNKFIFGSTVSGNSYAGYINRLNGEMLFTFMNGTKYSTINIGDIYTIHNLSIYPDSMVIDNKTLSLDLSNISNNQNIFLFNRSPYNVSSGSKTRIYSCYISDSDGYVRYYVPAKSKSGGVIGLYDAVSDTFITTSGSVPFASPIDDQVLDLQIGSFMTAGLGWIGNILLFAVDTPIIIVFMAIGLAGAMFRWGRRLVHF